ncbi:zinc finger, CCHC-type containing protein [Tanacetum coccineum]
MDDAAMKHMASNFSKLDKFEGVDFRRWQKKMHFLLSNMSVMLTISPNVEVSFFTLLRTTDDVEDVTFDVYALPCFGLVLFVMALFIHAFYLCDLNVIPSLENKKYFVTFIDDASRFCYVSLLHTKDEALDKLKVFKTEVKLQQRSLIKRFRTDRGAFHGFRFFVIEPNDSVAINSIIKSKDVIFDENRFSSVLRPSFRIPNRTEDIGGSVVPEEKGTRDEVFDQHSYCFNVEDGPKTFDETMKSQDVAFWKEAINDEMDSIMGNNTWVLADLPLVVRISTIRLLIAMASIHNLIIHQMDVKTAFLNDDLDEEAPKQLHQKFDEVILSNGYLVNQAEKYVYSNFDETGKEVIICLYVDDMLIFGTDQVQVDLTKEFLSSRFSMKDIGEADVILGIRIKHESNGITISQSHYIEKVLKNSNYKAIPAHLTLLLSQQLEEHFLDFVDWDLNCRVQVPSLNIVDRGQN